MEITAEIIASFRAKLPQFADDTEYPDPVLTIALCEGDEEAGGSGWGSYEDECHNFKQRGMFAFAAHWLTVTYPSGASDASVVNPTPSWSVNGKSVGDMSITYSNGGSGTGGFSGEASWLMSTQYGQQFHRLRKQAGMGARCV